MGLISPDLSGIVDGAVGDASDWTTPMNTIINLINGGLDTNNFTAASTNLTTIAQAVSWGTWSPSYYKSDQLTALTATTLSARYIQIGKLVWANIKAGTISDPGGASIYFSLPVAARNDSNSLWVGAGDANTGGTPTISKCFILASQTAKAGVQYPTSAAWGASANSFGLTLTYEAA